MRNSHTAVTILVAGIAIFLMSISPNFLAQQGPQPPPPFAQMYRMPVVYSVPGMDKVEVRRELVYRMVDGKDSKVPLKLDAYVPADGKPHPAVVLISGGGIEGAPFDFRDAGGFQSYGRMLAASGFVGISFSKRYQRGPEGTSKGGEDTLELVGYLREHASDLHIDKDRIAFWAFSAGGMVLGAILHDTPPGTRALVCFYCALDVPPEAWADMPSVTSEQRERARAAVSSVVLVHNSDRPLPAFFIGRAGLDAPFLNRGIDLLVQEALSKNLTIEVMNHPQGRHAFDILDDNERSREIIRRALEFLQSRLDGRG